MRRFFILLVLSSLLYSPVLALDGVLRTSDGKPLAGAQISIAGSTATSRSDSKGFFAIELPLVPVTLIVLGPRGEIYDPVVIEKAGAEVTEIVVRGGMNETLTVVTGVAPNIDAPPAAATSVVGREEMEQRTPEHIVDVLERTAGTQRRGEGPSAVPVVRGLAGGRTMILLDGARLSAERRAGPSATFLDPFTLAALEISRGPGSVAYGSDAFGGVVHARPRDPVEGNAGFRYHLSSALGATDFRSAGLEMTQDLFGGSILAGLHARDANEAEAGRGIAIPNSAYQDHGLAVRFARNGADASFRIGLAIDRAKDVEAPAADSLITRTFYPDEKSDRLTASWDAAQRFFDAVQVRGSISTYDITTVRERQPNATTTRQVSASGVEANDGSFRATATRASRFGKLEIGTDFNSRFGLHATGSVQNYSLVGEETTRTEEVSVDDAYRHDLGVFALLERQVAPLLLASAGVRGDYIAVANRNGYFGDHSRHDVPTSGHLALTAGPFRSTTATIQLASGFREPTLSDRYFRGVSGRGFVIGNPDLEPERSRQLDAAIRWQHGSHSVALFGYDYRIRDLVERYRSGTDYRFRNRGEAQLRGIELEVAANLPYGFAAQAFASFARGETTADGKPLDDIGAPTAHVALHWQQEKLSAFIHGFAYAADNRPGPVEVKRPGYGTIDLGAGWRLSDALDIRLHARNILDKQYAGSADANAALAPGRSVSLALAGTVALD